MTTLEEIRTKITKIKLSQTARHSGIVETLKMIVEFLDELYRLTGPTKSEEAKTPKSFLQTKKERTDGTTDK